MVATKLGKPAKVLTEQEKEDRYYEQYGKVIDAIGESGATKPEIVRATEIDNLIVETILRDAVKDTTLIRIGNRYFIR